MEKKCFKCGRTLPLDSFYVHRQMKDGHLNKCKDCAKEDVAAYRISNPERLKEQEAKRNARPERQALRARRSMEWRTKNPHRYRAQTVVGNAVRDGKLVKPETCEVCGMKRELHAHHADYDKPLDVLWVCVKCHRDLHHAPLV